MPTGELTGLYQDMALTNVACRHRSPAFIIPRLLPTLPVTKLTGKVYRKDPNRADAIPQDTVRAPGHPAKRLYSENPDTIAFEIMCRSLEGDLPDEFRGLIDQAIMGELDVIQDLVDAHDLNREFRGVAAFEALPSSQKQTVGTNDQFSKTDSGNPVAYIRTYMNNITRDMGIRPNTLAMDSLVAQAIVEHPKFQERAKYTLPPAQNNAGLEAMQRLLAAVFSVSNVYIAEGVSKNTAAKKASASLTSIWGDNLVICYMEQPSLNYAGFGLNLRFNGAGNTPGETVIDGYVVERGRDTRTKSDIFVAHEYQEDKIVNSKAAFLLQDCLA